MLKKLFVSSLLITMLMAAAPGETFNLSVGTSKLVTLNYEIRNVAVGNPLVADVVVMSKNELLLNAKTAGITTLAIWNGTGHHDYTIIVYKNSDNATFKIYKLQNLGLMDSSGQLSSASNAPASDIIENLTSVLSVYLDSNMFSISPRINSVLVIATEQEHQKVKEVLDALDKREKMIVFEIEVYEIKDDNSFTHKLELGQKTTSLLTPDKSFPLGIGSFDSDKDGLSYELKANTSIYTNIYDNQDYLDYLAVNLKYLQTEGKATLLARPKILTLNNKHAYIMSGEKIPVEQRDSDGNANVQYLPTGVILGVLPRLDDEGNINCWIATQVSSLIADSGNAGGNPIIASRETMSQVRLRDNETLILGGLIKETESTIERKIPLVGDLFGWVPILGGFVKNQIIEKSASELVITLKPEIINDGGIY